VTTNIFRFPKLDALNQFPFISFFDEHYKVCAEYIGTNFISFNVLLFGEFSGVISSIENINEPYVLIRNFESGSLYRYTLPECDYFMFVPNECFFREALYTYISKELPVSGYIWLSYLKNTEFRWHKDKIDTRLHYPIFIKSKSESLHIDNFSGCHFKEHLCYVFNPQQKHRVPMQEGDRLHLVSTCGKTDFECLEMAP
jgi:hypothetical protein